ncbi:MAG: hypothetical protein Altm1KO_18830 [Alteromonas macleodii]
MRRFIKVGEEVEIVGIKITTKTTCTGVEDVLVSFLTTAVQVRTVGVLLRGTSVM